jgi:hypothetical protein
MPQRPFLGLFDRARPVDRGWDLALYAASATCRSRTGGSRGSGVAARQLARQWGRRGMPVEGQGGTGKRCGLEAQLSGPAVS